MTSTTPTTTLIHAAAGNLRPAVSALSRVVSSKSTVAELKQILVEPVNRTTLRLSGTDLETFLSVEVLAEVPRQSEAFLVPLAQLQVRLKEARPADRVNLVPGPLPMEGFPPVPRFRAAPITLEPRIGQAILRAFACASTDESRMVIMSAFLDASGGEVHAIVGTDGKHLFGSNSFRLPELKESIILPAHKLWKSPLLRAEAPWTLRVAGESSSQVRCFRIEADGWSVTGKLIEGNYPCYRQVIPEATSFRAGVVIPERKLPELIKLLANLPGDTLPNRTVGLRVEDYGLSVLACASDTESFQEHPVPDVEVHGEPVTVFLNRDYLSQALSFGLNRVEIIDEISPVKLHRDGQLMIVMPVRCQGGEVSRKRPEAPVRESSPLPEKAPEPIVRPVVRRPKELPNEIQPRRIPREAPADPIEAAARQLMQVREALKVADSRLTDLVGTLRVVSRNRRQTEREMRAVRGTLRHLRKIEL